MREGARVPWGSLVPFRRKGRCGDLLGACLVCYEDSLRDQGRLGAVSSGRAIGEESREKDQGQFVRVLVATVGALVFIHYVAEVTQGFCAVI